MSQNQLRRDLEKKLGYSIRTKNDAIALETSIFEETGLLVSYNTIRRFFGLVHGGQARLSVLDIYAQYLGYRDFKTYEDNKNRFEFYNQWSVITQRKYWQLSDINNLVQESLLENRAAQGQLLWVLTNILKEEPIDEWARWFSVEAWKVEEERFGHIIFFLDNLGPIIRQRIIRNTDVKELLSHSVLIKYLVLLFVDYTTLSKGFYSKVLPLLSNIEEYSVFTTSLRGMQALFNGDHEKAYESFSKIKSEELENSNYPIINSRILGAQLYSDWFETGKLSPTTYQKIIELLDKTPSEQFDLAAMEFLPMAALLGFTNEVISISKIYHLGEDIPSDWTVVVNLDLIRLSTMIAYARAGIKEMAESLEKELNPKTWYSAYQKYLQALYAIVEILLKREHIQYQRELDSFPGLKKLI